MYTADLNILCGGGLWTRSDPDEVLNLNFDLLRDEASNALIEMGLTPAT